VSKVEFLVGRVEPDGLVVGHNGNVDFSVGQMFSTVEKVRVEGKPPDLCSVELGLVASVRLVVQEVHHWRKVVQVAPRGHAIGLRLRGQGIRELSEALLSRREHEYLYLRSSTTA
jgi:hypothetical protein